MDPVPDVPSDSLSPHQPEVWTILSTESVPAEARPGQFVFHTDTGALFLIGAI